MGEQRVFGRSFHEYENEPSPEKKRFINIILIVFALLIIVLGVIFGIILWRSSQANLSIGVETPESINVEEQPDLEQPVISRDAIDTSNWITYTNEAYGFELQHPHTWSVGDQPRGPDELYIRATRFDDTPRERGPNDNALVPTQQELTNSRLSVEAAAVPIAPDGPPMHSFISYDTPGAGFFKMARIFIGNDEIKFWTIFDGLVDTEREQIISNIENEIGTPETLTTLYTFDKILSTFRFIDTTPVVEPDDQGAFDELPVYQDLALGIEFRHTTSTFTHIDSGLSDPVRANVYLVPRAFRDPDGTRDIRFTVNRNVSSSTAEDWITRTLPQAQIIQQRNGFHVVRYVVNNEPTIVAIQAVRGNLYFFYAPSDTITDAFTTHIDSFRFLDE